MVELLRDRGINIPEKAVVKTLKVSPILARLPYYVVTVLFIYRNCVMAEEDFGGFWEHSQPL